MLAVLGGHLDCVCHLLERGALPDMADKAGRTALHRGVTDRRLSFTQSGLLRHNQALSPGLLKWLRFPLLLDQAALGRGDCVSALLEHEAYTLCRDARGRPPLHVAASRGHAEVLRCLLGAAARADPQDCLLDYGGYTPLHWAAYHGESAPRLPASFLFSLHQKYFPLSI